MTGRPRCACTGVETTERDDNACDDTRSETLHDLHSTSTVVAAVPDHVPFGRSGEEADLPAGVPEQDGLLARESLLAHVGDQRAERLGGVRVIDEDALAARRHLLRFARLVGRNAVAFADARVVDLELGIEARRARRCRE